MTLFTLIFDVNKAELVEHPAYQSTVLRCSPLAVVLQVRTSVRCESVRGDLHLSCETATGYSLTGPDTLSVRSVGMRRTKHQTKWRFSPGLFH